MPGASGRPRSLMDIPTYAPSSSNNDMEDPLIPEVNKQLTGSGTSSYLNSSSSSSTSQNKLDPDRLEEEIVEAEKKISTLQVVMGRVRVGLGFEIFFGFGLVKKTSGLGGVCHKECKTKMFHQKDKKKLVFYIKK